MTTDQTKKFILAGQAIFTISNGKPAPDARDYTYKVTRKELDSWDGRNPTAKKAVYFVALLSGPDNTADYSYLGVLDADNGRVRLTAKSNFLETSTPVIAIGWALGLIWAGKSLPGNARLQHVGLCGKCGDTLTVPESIDRGLGPTCSGEGYTKTRNVRKPRAKKAPKPTFEQLRAQAAAAALAATDGLGLPAAPAADPTPTLALPAEAVIIEAQLAAERAADGAEFDPELEAERLLALVDLSFVSQSPYAGRRIAEASSGTEQPYTPLRRWVPTNLDINGEDSVDRAERALGVS